MRYLVPADAAHALRRGRDTLVIFEDRDRDGAHDHRPGSDGHEPAAALDIPVAKAVNYIALGDSYSSGEAGRPDTAGFAGSYQNGVSPADPHCRRWSEAYPNVVTRELLGDSTLGINVSFATFACTGAITHNIHDPRGIGEDVTEDDLIATNKPSHPVPSLRYDPDTGQLLPRPNDWEPRQAASLANIHAMNDVDMITITIGGNDAGFANVVQACVKQLLLGNVDSTCDEDDLALSWTELQDRLEDVLASVRTAAPQASVFALGYGPVTPRPTPCPSDHRACPELGLNSLIDACPALSAVEILRHTVDRDLIPFPLGFASAIAGLPLTSLTELYGLTVLSTAPGAAKVDHVEATFLWSSAQRLNSAIRDASAAAGVHFVDVAGMNDNHQGDAVFAGHDPCSDEPWLHGFVLDQSERTAVSNASFHPTRDGHVGYAQILERHVRGLVSEGVELTEAGLPANPEPAAR